MVSFTTSVIAALAFAVTSIAAPTVTDVNAVTNGAIGLVSRTGSITWYEPGLGACGQTHRGTDAVAAVGKALFDRERPCGRTIRVSYKGRSHDVRAVDRCEACGEWDVDLSPSSFQKVIGPLGIGRVKAAWNFV